jgi:hypothetical protein
MDDDDDRRGPPRQTEFDCPECNANNPVDDGFVEGEDLRCFYCGAEIKVVVQHGRMKLKLV